MKKLNPKDAVPAVLLGIMGISTGIALATVMQVEVAPPIQALPLPVVNVAWSLVFYHLVKNDVRAGYYGCVLLGLSVITLPILVFFNIIGNAPPTVPAHFVGVTTDMVFGISLVTASVKALVNKRERAAQVMVNKE